MTKQGPLTGFKVLDLTTVVFGPYCTQILADMGAEVIKIEAPVTGDAFRWSARPATTPGMAPAWMSINNGKKSVALDIKDPVDRETILGLLRDADAFIVNVRAKALERVGLDFASVHQANPAVVYVHCVGFGQDGPYADLQAYDDLIQAATGTACLLSRVDGNPAPRYIPSLIADKVAGLHAAYGTLAALLERTRTGQGQLVEVPMFEAFTHFMMLEHLGGLTFDPPNGPEGYPRQLDPDRQPFPTADGFVSIVAYTDASWGKIFEILGEPELIQREDFDSTKKRLKKQSELYRELRRLTSGFRTAEIVERCHAVQIPAFPIHDIPQVLEDSHLQATGFFNRREHPTEGGYLELAQPVIFAGSRPQREKEFPARIGEHTEAVRTKGWSGPRS